MKKTMTLVTLSVMLLMASCGKKENAENTNSDNPFLQTWDTPYGVPPFEKIKPEHYLPAFEEGMKQQKAEIDAIVNNEEAPTFENTIIPYEYSGQLLYNVTMVFFNLSSACNSDEMIAIAEEISPKLSAHGDDISLNKKLFERIKAVYDQKESLNLEPIDLRLLEETYNSFVRGGANIPEEKQARFREINSELSTLTLKFENNVLAATNNYKLVLDANDERIADMPQALLNAAKEEGNKTEETKGKCVFTLQMPSWEPFMQNCSNRELRKEMWDAYVYRCTTDSLSNADIINKIANLRLERAQMFGYPSHAAFILDDNMAKTPEAVNNLLMQVWTPALQKAKEEAAEYQAMINKGADKFKLEAWDWRYYSEKLRREKYNLNDEETSFVVKLFETCGEVVLCNEKTLDAIGCVSGTGPAYVMLFIEAMADAAVSLGIKREDALKIAAATVQGSGKLVLETGIHPAVLKDQVCSPGGTTIAGVMALEENGLRNSVIKAVLAADNKTKAMTK